MMRGSSSLWKRISLKREERDLKVHEDFQVSVFITVLFFL